jgi:hypothetical protein
MSPRQLRRTIVITEELTDAQTAANRAVRRLTSNTVDEFVAEPLMRAFPMVVIDEFRHGSAEVPRRAGSCDTVLHRREGATDPPHE